jgi:hypothetical protein
MPGPLYRPFAAPPYRATMGLQPLDLAEWIEIDHTYATQMAQKRGLLAERHGEVFQALPEALEASQEILRLLLDHLPQHFPHLFRREGDRFANLATGESWPLDSSPLHPLDLAGRLVQEDFCLMEGSPYRLTAASLCFPARWTLAEKFGRPMQEIHAPVPLYPEKLAKPVDRFFEHLKTDKPVWRTNFSLIDDPALFQTKGHSRTSVDASITPETVGDRVFLRIERQTLHRLPHTEAILFTIRTHVWPLTIFTGDPGGAADLAETLRTMPEQVYAYKSMPVFGAAALAYLDRIAASAPAGGV